MSYEKQDRGDISEYERYFAGMDASMQQKIALTTAHFPTRGRVADMGSGSGSGTFDLARLFAELELIGVDINPVTVDYSNSKYRAGNLRFVVGDIADRIFPAGSLDGILDSSVLHHVTSFNGFDRGQVDRTIRNQVAQLRTGGVLIIRDFVIPENGRSVVRIELPETDGSSSGPVPELSTAALFEVFARDFRSSANPDSAVPFRHLTPVRPGFARFETTLRYAAEFVLRKDYRDHWEPELLEEYTYYSQEDFEENFRRENLRIVVSMPLWNPWIVANRFRDRFRIEDGDAKPVHFPPTNYLIAGEKVAAGEGVVLKETARSGTKPGFLAINRYRHRESGRIFELAERPNRTIDLLPWYEPEAGRLFILAKKDFPRPVVNAGQDSPNLNRAQFSGYLTEPITAIVETAPDDAAVASVLGRRAGIRRDEIGGIDAPFRFFTSPGGLDERVETFLVGLRSRERRPVEIDNYTPFASAGTVRELDALQVLRASHVGGMFDARLEIGIYRLLSRLGRSAGTWIGAEIRGTDQEISGLPSAEIAVPVRAVFEDAGTGEIRFLDVRRSVFSEFDAAGREIAGAEFEYVVPRTLSKNTAAAIPFAVSEGRVLVGIESRDLPAPQRFSGSSAIECVPAWRLPRTVGHKFDIEPFIAGRFAEDFRVAVRRSWELGGAYFTSAGVTSETVYPFAAEIDVRSVRDDSLRFLPIRTLLDRAEDLQDAHFLILVHRLGHALGIL